MTDLFIFVGEQSADLYGYQLLRTLKQTVPHWKIYGIGGPQMRSLDFECLQPMEDFQLMNVADYVILRHKIKRHFERAIASILQRNPRIVLLIDYPGGIPLFAQKLRKRGYKGKIVQYICPSLLFLGKASRKAMDETLDALFTIFPFEKPLFENSAFPVTFVGHPVLEKLENHHYCIDFKQKFSIDLEAPLLGIFPGSRSKVLKANFHSQLSAALRLQKEIPSLWIGVSAANQKSMKMIEPWVKDLPQVVVMPETDTYDLMKGCSIAIASSGTSPLELALHEKPTVVTYGGTFFDRLVVKYYSKWSFPYYCLVNVVANRSVFAELIYKDCSSEKIYEEMKRVYLSDERKRCCVAQCKRMKDMIIHRPDTLTYQYASRHVAHLLMAML